MAKPGRITRPAAAHYVIITLAFQMTGGMCPSTATTTFVEQQLIWSSFLLPLLAVKPVDVEGVEGMQVSLPCPLAASTSDKVYMVLWFRDGVGIPLYR